MMMMMTRAVTRPACRSHSRGSHLRCGGREWWPLCHVSLTSMTFNIYLLL
jgi:hypothetical protein